MSDIATGGQPGAASALSVSRGSLSGGQLRVEGSGAAPGIFVTVTSSASAAGARSDINGGFRIQAAGFSAPDCTAVIDDRRTPLATVKLSGCTPTVAPPPATPPPPTGSCGINPGSPATYPVGDLSTYFFTTTGCVGGPLQWTTLAGRIPTGMTGPFFQGQDAGAVSGRPTTEGTYTFTVQATDGTGSTDAETLTITITAPRPLTVASAALPAAAAGRSYQVQLAADGGLPGYLWTLRGGSLPGGFRLTSNGAVAGVAASRGTFSFAVRVTDSRGTTAERTLALSVT